MFKEMIQELDQKIDTKDRSVFHKLVKNLKNDAKILISSLRSNKTLSSDLYSLLVKLTLSALALLSFYCQKNKLDDQEMIFTIEPQPNLSGKEELIFFGQKMEKELRSSFSQALYFSTHLLSSVQRILREISLCPLSFNEELSKEIKLWKV